VGVPAGVVEANAGFCSPFVAAVGVPNGVVVVFPASFNGAPNTDLVSPGFDPKAFDVPNPPPLPNDEVTVAGVLL
jgi:hypothetical protein